MKPGTYKHCAHFAEDLEWAYIYKIIESSPDNVEGIVFHWINHPKHLKDRAKIAWFKNDQLLKIDNIALFLYG